MMPRTCVVLTAACFTGCVPNAVFFYETTKLAFQADFKPDASEPAASTLGYKRRIVAVVPPQKPAKERRNQNAGHRGEALSMVSTFSVEAKAREGLEIQNHFLTGVAARVATARSPKGTVQALTAPEALVAVPPPLQNRRKALAAELSTMPPERAEAILGRIGKKSTDDSRFELGREIIGATTPKSVDDLERAFKTVPQ